MAFNKMIKALTILLSVTMTVTCVPGTSFADPVPMDEEYYVQDAEVLPEESVQDEVYIPEENVQEASVQDTVVLPEEPVQDEAYIPEENVQENPVQEGEVQQENPEDDAQYTPEENEQENPVQEGEVQSGELIPDTQYVPEENVQENPEDDSQYTPEENEQENPVQEGEIQSGELIPDTQYVPEENEQENSVQEGGIQPEEPVQDEEYIPEENEQENPVQEDEVLYPAFTPDAAKLDNAVVCAWAPEGVFPKGAVLSVIEGLPADKQEQITAALEPLRDKEKDVMASYSFAMQVLASDGITELEPAGDAKIQAAFSLTEVVNHTLEPQIYQVTEDKSTGEFFAEKPSVIPDAAFWGESGYGDPEITIVAETDRFSYFIIEFTQVTTEEESSSQIIDEESAPEEEPGSQIIDEESAPEEESGSQIVYEESAPEEESGSQIVYEESAPEEESGSRIIYEETAPEEETKIYPAFMPGTVEIDGVKIGAYAPEGVFPEGAILSVEEVTEEEQKQADAEVAKVRDTDQDVAAAYTFHIRVLAADGVTELEPAADAKARIFFSLPEVKNEELEAFVYRINMNSETGALSAKKLDVLTDEALSGISAEYDREITAAVDTDSFGYVTIELTNHKEKGNEKESEPAEEETGNYPAFTPETVEIDGVKISVYAPEGVFPEGAMLSVAKVAAPEQEEADTAVDGLRDTERNVAVSYTFDIKVLSAEGTELEPTDKGKVKVAFSLVEAADENLETDIYHVTKDEETGELSAEKLDILPEAMDLGEAVSVDPETTVVVETDGFSYYTVEFTYTSLQYVLEGDSSVPMREILEAVGLTGEVTAADVSSPDLFSASNDSGEWIVTAHRDFTSTEWMKVTINDVVYEITVTDDIASTTADSWEALQARIDAIQGSGEIKLSQNIVNTNNKTRIIVNGGKKITIDLAGHELNRKRSSKDKDGHVIEVCDTSELTVIDSSQSKTGTIKGGYSEKGGGIYVHEGATLKVEGGTIMDNHASDDGGGLYVKGTLIMTGGAVKSNIADDCGGGIFCEKTGHIELDGVAISSNNAKDGGGMKLWMGADSAIQNCQITDNRSSNYGGGIYMDASSRELTISNTQITNNTSSDDGAGIYLNHGTISMTGGSLSHNTSNNDSGGAKITSKTTFNADGVLISSNKAINEEGGGIKNYGTTTLKNCTVIANEAKKEGGGIFNDNDDDSAGKLTIENCTITGNSSQSNGGGVYSDKKLILIGGDRSQITDNHASNNGGGIFIGNDSSDTDVKGAVVVKGNYAANTGKDIYLRNGKLSVTGTLTDGTNNAAIGITKEDDNGIGIFTTGYGASNKTTENIIVAPATYFFSPEGFDIDVNNNGEAGLTTSWADLQAQINNASNGDTITLTHNYTASAKNDRLQVGKNITIDLAGYTLNRNLTSDKKTGNVLEVLAGATLTITDSSKTESSPGTGKITGGYAEHGGGIYVNENAKLIFQAGTITGNNADNDGGGIYVKGILEMTGGTISKNNAYDNGGGIFSDSLGRISLTNAVIKDNYAKDDGGGMKLWMAADSTIDKCQITANRSGDKGAGMYVDASGKKLTITDTTIDDNSSSGEGGGIYLYKGTIDMTRGSISNNTKGGVKISSGTSFAANETTINKNAEQGGVRNFGTTALKSCTISGNSSKKHGGGIFNDNDDKSAGDLTIENCTITGNTSGDNGGGIYSDKKLTIKGDNTIGGDITEGSTANTAAGKGGGIFIGKDSDVTSIEGKLIIKNNKAAAGENDLYLREGQVLTLTGAITGTEIGKIDMDSAGIFTKNYGYRHWNDDPGLFFCKSDSAIPAAWDEAHDEAQLTSSWPVLQNLIDEAIAGRGTEPGGHTVKLEKDYTAGSNDVQLMVRISENGDGRNDVTIDLNGHILNRNLTSRKGGGHVLEVYNGATLIIKDSATADAAANTESSDDASDGAKPVGIIMGGYATNGGGIYVNENATLEIQSGTILGNHATSHGGGILNYGTLRMTGGTIIGNGADKNGGGIYSSDSSSLNLTDVTICNNTAGDNGGGLNIRLRADSATIQNCTISENAATEYGGGIRLDASGKLLIIKNTNIDSNYSLDDGAGIYLNNGMISMIGGSLSENTTLNDGGGAKISYATSFHADGVKIQNNKAMTEEGGGIKNAAITELENCTISGNSAKKEGGGVFNGSNLTIEECVISDNSTRDVGGGIYSDAMLTIKGRTIIGPSSSEDTKLAGNSAENKGGGIYIGSSSTYIKIQGAPVVKGNSAGNFGNDLYLRSGEKLVLSGALTEPSNGPEICVDLENGVGVLTESYKTYNQTEDGEAKDPTLFFASAAGYDLSVNDKGEVEITSGWSGLQDLIDKAKSGDVILLEKDYAASTYSDRLKIKKNITIDLNGHTLNRNRKDETDDGHVLEVFGGSTLTIKDRSENKTGTITGGWAENGGGIYVNQNAVLNMEGGTVTGNRADKNGGGIYVKGTVNFSGGKIEKNSADDSGGGIYLDGSSAVLNLTGGRITDNNAAKNGGGIMVTAKSKVNANRSPYVYGNHAANGVDLYLPSGTALGVTGAFTDDAQLGIALESKKGKFTSGYTGYNENRDPSRDFVSTEGYAIYIKDREASFALDSFGKTVYEDPFITWNNQINTDSNSLNSYNWMSGVSGERYLHEINMPRAHDAGMYKIDMNHSVKGQKALDIMSVIAVGGTALFALGTYLAAGFTGGASLVLLPLALKLFLGTTLVTGAVNMAVPTDWTNKVAIAGDAVAAEKAQTQIEYIYQELDDGARILDLRLNNRQKVYHFIGENVFNGWKWEDDGKNLWICHGKAGGGTYQANDPDGDYLSLDQVLTWVKAFLAEHPTETIMLNLTPETEDPSQHQVIYERARTILEASLLQINPATGEPYLYKDPSSDDYFVAYDMPKLADCRGKVVFKIGAEIQPYVGGMDDSNVHVNDTKIEYQGGGTYSKTWDQLTAEIQSTAETRYTKPLPTTADEHLYDWYSMGLNSTGQDVGQIKYALSMDPPYKLAEKTNEALFGEGKVYSSEKNGTYLGIVSMDRFQANYSEIVWKTNFFEGLQYCTVTVKSGLSDGNYPDQEYQILKGTTLTVPGNIYKQLEDGRYFLGWTTSESSSIYNEGSTFKVNENVTFTAQWAAEGQIPVSIVWKDGDNADKLRPDAIDLVLTNSNGATSNLTLTQAEDWRKVTSADIKTITPDWTLVDTSNVVTKDGITCFGKDEYGKYKCEIRLEIGTGYIITFTHTPHRDVTFSGYVTWEDDNDAAKKRPEYVTIYLYNGSVEAANPVTANADSNWRFVFADRPGYENGEEIAYTISQVPVENYRTTIDGFSITNTYVPDKKEEIKVSCLVNWDDVGDAKKLRPGSVTVTLKADGQVVNSVNVEEIPGGLWVYSFEGLPKTDDAGNLIDYTIESQSVTGYNVTCEKVIVEDSDTPDILYNITYTLQVQDETEKDAVVISAVPEGITLSYNGKEQILVKEGEADGGTMLYALGTAETHPEANKFSSELPTGTDAGTYYVWYYVKGDVLHTDSQLESVEAVIEKAAQTIVAEDVEAAVGDAGKFVVASVTGVKEEAAGGLGTLSFAVTEGFDYASIDPSTGKLTLLAEGTAKVMITAAETANYEATTKEITVTVKAAAGKENQEKPDNIQAKAVDAYTIQVVEPAEDTEYILLPAGRTPTDNDWAKANRISSDNTDIKWTNLQPAAAYTVWARRYETDTKNASEANNQNVSTPKEDQTPPDAPNAKAVSRDTIIVSPAEKGMEYTLVSMDTENVPEDAWLSLDANGEVRWEGLETDTTYKVFARKKGTDTKNPSDPSDASEVKTLAAYTLKFYNDTEGVTEWKSFTLDAGTSLAGYADYGTREPNVLRKDGYTFAGWTTEQIEQNIVVDSYKTKEGILNEYLKGILFDFDGTITEDMNAYPIWIRDRLQVVINKGSDENDVKIDSNQALEFTVNINEKIGMRYLKDASRPGYDLSGWYTTGGVLWNGDEWTTLNYADNVLKETEGYEVTPEYCDKTISGEPIIIKNPVRKFNYYTVTLTAEWAPKNITVKYALGDHKASDAVVPEAQKVSIGDTMTLADAPKTDEAYVFIGWKAPAGVIYSAGGTFLINDWSAQDDPDADEHTITLNAYYVEKAKVKLIFDANGGTAVEPLTEYEGNTIDLNEDRYATTRTGYDFDGCITAREKNAKDPIPLRRMKL